VTDALMLKVARICGWSTFMRSTLLSFLVYALSLHVAVAADLAQLQAVIAGGDALSAIPELQEEANAGNPRAAAILASLYQRGEGVEKDPARAIELYKTAADLGDAEAQFNLGNIYLLGEGVPADEVWALTYYRDAASQGHELALRNMNQLYEAAGIEPPQLSLQSEPNVAHSAPDEPSVESHPAVEEQPLAATTHVGADDSSVVKSADDDVVEEQVSEAPAVTEAVVTEAVVVPAELPESVPPAPTVSAEIVMSRDEREAIALAEKHGVAVQLEASQRAELALPSASPRSTALAQAVDALDADPSAAVQAIEALAEQDFAPAQFEMARLHLAGQGVEQDVEGAVNWLQRASNNGHSQAQFDLANRYLTGAGVEPDDAQAITLFRDAARSGHNLAEQRLQGFYDDAGIPMPDLERPRTIISPPPATMQIGAAEPHSAETDDRSLVHADVEPSVSAPPQTPLEPEVDDSVSAANSVPQQAPYEYPVIDHDATPLQQTDSDDINPAKPENHTVVAGSVLSQSSASASTAAAVQEVASEPGVSELESVAIDTTTASEPAAAVESIDQAVSSATPVATMEVAETAVAGATAQVQAGVGAIDQKLSDGTANDVADDAAAQKEAGFFGKLRDALGGTNDEAPGIASRAPGASAPAVAVTQASPPGAEMKLAIAAHAEPDPPVEKPTLEQAKASLNAGDFATAAAQFTTLARDGNAEAQAHIGYMTYQGEGVTRDKAAAVEWYRLSAVQGNRDAQYNLAVAYAFGEGVPQDDPEAVNWYRRAAQQGSAIAQYSLAVSYALGEGVAQDDAEAARWYTAAAEQGYPAAQYNLAYMYRAGQGIAQSDTEALRWFLQAAQNGHASAQYSLGYMYRSGKGVTRSIDEAIRWYRLAAAQGHPEARADLTTLAPDR